MTDTTITPPVGASVWERVLWTHLTSHIAAERDLLEEYSAVAERTGSKALRYLVELLIEDEIRHHRMFKQLADSLKTQAETIRGEPAIPNLDFNRANRDEVLDITDRLIALEKSDAEELKELQRTLKDVKDTTLWGLVVELMQRDTQKHLALLRFARKSAARR